MKLAVLLVCVAGAVTVAEAGQSGRQSNGAAPPPAAVSTYRADAYNQYLLGRRLERDDDVDGAVAAYKRAIALDPGAADVQAELAGVYLRQNRVADSITTAEQALRIDPESAEAHRVLGTLYAAVSDTDTRASNGRRGNGTDDNALKAISHLEKALANVDGEAEPNLRAALARMYVRTGAYDKAIPVLRDLVSRERGWQDGVSLLADAYASAGKNAEAIAWLEQEAPENPRLYATLGDFYERARRWSDSATAYAIAVERQPRNLDLKIRYGTALINAGGRENAVKAREALTEVAASRSSDQRVLYLLSQAQRRAGDPTTAEATARRLVSVNKTSPWGYYALAEALTDRQQYQGLIDALTPALNDLRSRSADAASLAMLLPHVGFAYEQLGQRDAAIATFAEAHRLEPDNGAVTAYLIQANLSARKFDAAVDVARTARARNPDDLRLARLHAQALRQGGHPDQAISVLQELVGRQADKPIAYVALAQVYQETNRATDAIRTLEQAQAKFPSETAIPFELGAVFEKQKRFSDAEAAFRKVLALDDAHAPALNYLGYMLADRGERLDESVAYLKKALQIDPDNGSYLDSLGWAYYKENKLDLAADNLQRAADQLRTNGVIQDHYGDVLFKLGRYDEAISAWTRALSGDEEGIDRAGVDKKIRDARQKLKK